MSIDCPGYPLLFKTLNSLVLDSWFRNNLHAVYSPEDMHMLSHAARSEILRLGIKDNHVLCTSVAISAFLALQIAGAHETHELHTRVDTLVSLAGDAWDEYI